MFDDLIDQKTRSCSGFFNLITFFFSIRLFIQNNFVYLYKSNKQKQFKIMNNATITNQVLRLSSRKGNKVSEKFNFEAKKFLSKINCELTKELKIGKRYENGPFEMVYLELTNKFYFVSNI